MATISLDNIDVTYKGTTTGVHNIDLEIRDGEFLALIGPSGSGKTTLLRTIAGFIRPQQGTLTIGGTVVSGPGTWVQPENRDLGMVFQQHAIWPHWNVGQNVAYPLKLKRVKASEIRQRVATALEQVGLGGAEKRKPSTLSGGQRQRVAIARALVTRPAALLLDEALSSLDEPLRDRLRGELKELVTEFGLTVVHVTHDRAEALSLADRVVTLQNGLVEQIGEPEHLVTTPANEFMARFMNDATLLTGTLADDDDGATFTSAESGEVIHAQSIERMDAASGDRGTLAILPQDVRVSDTTDGRNTAVVKSVLFGRSAYDVLLDYHGRDLRVQVETSRRPVAGEKVEITVRRALFFAAADANTQEKVA